MAVAAQVGTVGISGYSYTPTEMIYTESMSVMICFAPPECSVTQNIQFVKERKIKKGQLRDHVERSQYSIWEKSNRKITF